MRVTAIALFTILAASVASAQTPPPASPPREQVLYEDAAVRVVKASVPPHQEVTLGDHPNGVMITLLLPPATAAADTQVPTPAPLAPVKVTGVTARTRILENVGDQPQDVLIVDFKAAPAPAKAVVGARQAAPRQGLEIRTLFDDERVTVDHYRLAPGYRDPTEHPHQWETIIIHVVDNDMAGAGEGSVRRQFARGNVAMIPANKLHAFGNHSTKPAEFLYVRLK